MTIVHSAEQIQVPLLAMVLLGAGAAKLSRALRARSVLVVLDALSLFPPRLRRPVTMAVCLTELCLGAAIVVTSGRAWHGWAPGVRLAAALFFLVAAYALAELRESRPDLGCGCFGELSGKPPGLRSVLRAGLLAAAALASAYGGGLTLPRAGPAVAAGAAILVAEFLLVAALSPEVGEVLARLGYTEPCELRTAPPQRAVASLRRSRIWRRHAALLRDTVPVDMWRELCWWYLVYPGRDGAGECDVVFAVEVRPRRPAIRAAVVPRESKPAQEEATGQPREALPDGLSPAF
jgi:Methylamine utilisation protein MauE